MEINQLLPTVSYGDAVSNSALNMMKVLHGMGIKSNIYAENIHPKMKRFVKPSTEIPKNHHVLYHLSTGSDLAYQIPLFKAKKGLVYHNVTPSEFFTGYSGIYKKLTNEGREQIKFLSTHIDFSLAVSEFNRRDLVEYGYKNTYVSPIIINYEDYNKESDMNLFEKMQDSTGTNILFVGRIAPNKKQDDIIKTFYYYKKYINEQARLFLVGSYQGMERYYEELLSLIKKLELEDVFITGHTPFNQILSYYQTANLFLCMSEHEGFCVPLLEAMNFEIPILAYKSSAIAETLQNGGILLLDKDYLSNAELIDIVITNSALQERLIKNQKKTLSYFSKENTIEIFKQHINKLFLGE